MGKVIVWADSAYLAIAKLYPNWECMVHERAKRNQPLSREQKIANKLKSKIRIAIEHTIGKIKSFRCCFERVRNMTAQKQAQYWRIVAGILNLQKLQKPEFSMFLAITIKSSS